jgi:hypothetical protein
MVLAARLGQVSRSGAGKAMGACAQPLLHCVILLRLMRWSYQHSLTIERQISARKGFMNGSIERRALPDRSSARLCPLSVAVSELLMAVPCVLSYRRLLSCCRRRWSNEVALRGKSFYSANFTVQWHRIRVTVSGLSSQVSYRCHGAKRERTRHYCPPGKWRASRMWFVPISLTDVVLEKTYSHQGLCRDGRQIH